MEHTKEKFIVVRWVLVDDAYKKEMRVIYSNHPRFVVNSRFDFGFFQIATSEGYSIISLPIDEEQNNESLWVIIKNILKK